MQILINFFVGIGNFIIAIFSYLIEAVMSLAYVFELLTYFTANIPRYFAWLPSELLTLVVLTFGIAVIYKLFGREG